MIVSEYKIEFLKAHNEDKEMITKLVYDSFDRQKFNLDNKELEGEDVMLKNYAEITKDDLKDYFVTKKDERIYSFPYLKEESDFEFFGRKVIPAKGFLWHLHTSVEELGFGIIEVTFLIDRVSRNDNDTRFEKVSTVFREQKFYIYNYEDAAGVYEQVDLNADNEKTKEYHDRKRALQYAFALLADYDMQYVERLSTLGAYVVKNKTNVNKSEFIDEFLTECVDFLSYAEDKLFVKVLFSHIDTEEYDELKKKVEELKQSARKYKEELKGLLIQDELESINLTSLDVSHDPTFFRYKKLQQVLSSFVGRKLVPFLAGYTVKNIKNSERKHVTDELGFFKFTETKAFPTLFEIEKRRHFTKENEKKAIYEQEIADLIATKNKENKKHEVKDEV